MVRRCAVHNCNSSDINVISHRFPRSEKLAATWRDALGIKDIPLPYLISKYVVCTLHFARTDYRNSQSNFLNSTAIPKKPQTDPETPEKYSLMGMLDDYYGKPMSNYRKERDTTPAKSEKTIMVYEISEFQDMEALQEADNDVVDEQNNVVQEDENSVTEILETNDIDVDGHDNGEDDGIVMEYMPEPQLKKRKFDSDTTYVRLENNVVVALSEQEDDDGECYEENEDEQLQFHEERNLESDSIDVIFLEKDSNDGQYNDDGSVQIISSSKPEKQLDTRIKAEQQSNNVFESDYDEGEYASYTRKELIEKLLESNRTVEELETKLKSIQGAQDEMVKSIENFKKIFNA